MSEILIFEDNERGYFWSDTPDTIEEEIEAVGEDKFRYVFDNGGLFFHQCKRSALWDDMTGYVDQLQDEEELADDELYVVTYYKYDGTDFLEQLVDFGLTKQEIIQNVLDQKYVEGADYVTMGKLFYHTKMYLDGK